jgi:hypothetical protein
MTETSALLAVFDQLREAPDSGLFALGAEDPSIQPKHSASSTESDHDMLAAPVHALMKPTRHSPPVS